MRSGALLTGLIALALGSAGWADPADRAAADTALAAESLVRQLWYEGVPYAETQRFDARAVARLGAMLREPSLAEHHGNVVMALGMSGHPHAFALLDAYARAPLAGEVDRATFRARTRVAQAMGHLARSDRRALRWLLERADAPAPPPGWRFRHHRGDRLALLLDESVLSGLALTGAPEAEEVLRRVAGSARGAGAADPRLRRHAEHARETHRRVAQDGVGGLLEERTR